jgi:glycosyltransferase involved in cell wall biosynthesis
MKPLLTVAIPTYNRSPKLDVQLEWASRAIYDHWDKCELIVSDNASTDDTTTVCNKWKEKLSNLIVFRQSSNLGLVGNVNFCISHAQGKYVWTIGDDDPINLDAVISILKILENNENIGFLHLNHRCVSGIDGSIVHERFYPWKEDLYSEDGKQIIEMCLQHRQGGLMFITANILNTELANQSIQSWEYNTKNLAFPLYMSAWIASRSGVYVTCNNICDCVYYVSSWSSRILLLSHHDNPLTYQKMKEIGYSSELMNQLIQYPVSSFNGLKQFFKLLLISPKTFSESLNVFFKSILNLKIT